jgi:hypothetical protein
VLPVDRPHKMSIEGLVFQNAVAVFRYKFNNQCANGAQKMTWLDMVGIFRTMVF